MTATATTNTWTPERALELFSKPLMDLLFEAQTVHRKFFDPNEVQLSTLLSIKTGACSEDCKYCSQSGRHRTEVENEQLLPLEVVKSHAEAAKKKGATRFCMGAAWRSPPRKEMPKLVEMIREVRAMGLETCMTLGMLADDQVEELKEAGLDYYNHNIDTSEEYYSEVITTRNFQDRLDTLERVRDAGIKVCCGGIVGMGETREDRVGMLCVLANMPQPPESVPINKLVPIPGTPLGDVDAIDETEFVRTIATARIMMPNSRIRLSAGREDMSKSMQAMCFLAGANSIFYGEQLLTAPNAQAKEDMAMFDSFGIQTVEHAEVPEEPASCCSQ